MDKWQLTTDRLEQELLGSEMRIASERGYQCLLLRELDLRQVQTADGCHNLTEWTIGRLDVSPETAQVLVRTAKALADLPLLSEALAKAEVSFDRVAELSKTATPETEDKLLSESYSWDLPGLRRRQALEALLSHKQEHELFSARQLAIQPNLDYSLWKIWGALAGVGGALVADALLREQIASRCFQMDPGACSVRETQMPWSVSVRTA